MLRSPGNAAPRGSIHEQRDRRHHAGQRGHRRHRLEHPRPDLRAEAPEHSFSWHATFPPDTFVPPHIHPTQDEYLYILEGRLDLWLDGEETSASPGDFVRLPMGKPHGIFNKSGQTAKCLFWVSPTGKLYDLFWGIHNMKEQNPPDVVALSAKHDVEFLPPPPGA